MKAVVLHVSEEELAHRRLTGIDRFDEMWEGILHMAPAPAYEHQRIVTGLLMFLGRLCESDGRGTLTVQINVFGDTAVPSQDYRIPDLTFVAAGREQVLAADGARGGPDAVIEVRSPGDETYDKLPFFARLGVREVIVIDRDSKRTEIYRLAGTQYVAVAPDERGGLRSEVLAVRFLRANDRLAMEDLTNPSARAEV
jgi:Uma2 family endonuclease